MFGFNKHQLKNGILLAFILFLFTQLWQELIEEDNLATESSYQELSEKSFKTHGGQKWPNLVWCLISLQNIFTLLKFNASFETRTTDAQWGLFFIEIQNFWAWADKLVGQINFGHLWYFRPNYQHPFWYSKSLVHVYHYSTIISKKNEAFNYERGIWVWAAKN